MLSIVTPVVLETSLKVVEHGPAKDYVSNDVAGSFARMHEWQSIRDCEIVACDYGQDVIRKVLEWKYSSSEGYMGKLPEAICACTNRGFQVAHESNTFARDAALNREAAKPWIISAARLLLLALPWYLGQ
jgi:hypothetical protein